MRKLKELLKKNWVIDLGNLLLEILFLIVGGMIIFPSLFIIGFIYSFIKHILFKFDYSFSKHLLPILRSINLTIDGLANAGAGELLNDVLKVKQKSSIRYGRWYQTISAVTGLRLVYHNKDNWFRKFLEILGKDHSVKAITEEEHYYYNSYK